MRRYCLLGVLVLTLCLMAGAAGAQGAADPVNAGDTAFVLISAALVMLMTPGLALFYGGMVRSKNVMSTIMQSFILIGVVSVQWALWGYSLAFGPDKGGFIGGLEWIGLRGVGMDPNPDYAATVPHQAFMIYQAMFAVITPALITGAFAERIRFGGFLLFTVCWTTLVYDVVAHWVWGTGGWLRQMGALDFAGGTVVHLSSGVSALACAVLIGRRRGYGHDLILPHNLTMTVLGAGILWFGWFGFNAGSALSSGRLATSAFVATNTAAAAAALAWMILDWAHKGKPTVLGAASGAVAGLVGITPAAGFVGPMSSIAIGAGASLVCYIAVEIKAKAGYDDSLDAFGIHGVGGTWGALATGLFASKLVNEAGNNGLFFGNPSQLGVQALGVLATAVYSFVVTFILFKIINPIAGMRVEPEDEVTGLDLTQHGERGYNEG